tara:strand:+ start:1347 stop:2621 length:1275 start_codon:yes stop_codon:yes gene_type:complete
MKLFKKSGLAAALYASAALISVNAAMAQDQINLRMLIWSANEDHLRLLNEIADAYKAQNPQVSVTYEAVPYGEFPTTLTTQIAGGNAPDLTWLTETGSFDFIAAGAMFPLTETFRTTEGYELKDYAQASIDSWSQDGELYFYPFSTSPFAVFVNNDVVREANQKTPAELIAEGNWDWQHAVEIGSAVNGETGKHGIVFRDFDYTSWTRLAPLYTAWDVKLWSEDGKTCMMTSPEMVDAMSFLHDAIFEKKAMPGPGVAADFFAGDAAMTITQISRANLLPTGDNAFEWDLVPLPAGPIGEYGYVGAAGIGVLKASPHAQEAADFLAFFSNKENVTKLARYFPPTRSSVLTPEVLAASNPLLSVEQLTDVVIKGVTEGRSAAGHTNYEQIVQNVRASLDSLWVPDADVAQVLQATCDNLNPLLQR